MNLIDVVVTRIIDVRPYRHFWLVEVEANAYGCLTKTELIRDTEEQARSVKPGDVIAV
ncbi:hypothetical protein [Pantoea sp. DY-5]|uniref:hypothetical protein n=1 Tax=Pantoea sp. DY-5 TaxID=2871488 RepID=UPI001C95F10F|nr:hypothetical protein [Pantoea sp. DY-5]MBY4840997.1 hypothetical protein [Pantoea sp. DY-5]